MRRKHVKKAIKIDYSAPVYECIVGTRSQQKSNDEMAIHDLCARLGRSKTGQKVLFLEHVPGKKKPNLLFSWENGVCTQGIGLNE